MTALKGINIMDNEERDSNLQRMHCIQTSDYNLTNGDGSPNTTTGP
jgi:hypothetical protein